MLRCTIIHPRFAVHLHFTCWHLCVISILLNAHTHRCTYINYYMAGYRESRHALRPTSRIHARCERRARAVLGPPRSNVLGIATLSGPAYLLLPSIEVMVTTGQGRAHVHACVLQHFCCGVFAASIRPKRFDSVETAKEIDG